MRRFASDELHMSKKIVYKMINGRICAKWLTWFVYVRGDKCNGENLNRSNTTCIFPQFRRGFGKIE